ncbi:MAG TPA: class I SAM-dependent methyltransferase [Candidatus Binatia bacterium]|nr:class I SAM-dependent methyltransferase [Candidatus Binatia bacterium]
MAEQLRAAYRGAVPRYRRDDESEVQSRHHRRLWTILRSIGMSFSFPIAVLEAGCGTGRYFHCLENVDLLMGLDVSSDMLKGAGNPVLREQVSARRIDLICENVFHVAFPPGSFDFIYSLGMFGNGCPVTSEICERFFTWLKAGGKLFFDVLSLANLPLRVQMRRTARRLAYPLFPARVRRRLDQRAARMPLFALSRSDLEDIMRSTSFSEFDVSIQADGLPRWGGAHLECLAVKS